MFISSRATILVAASGGELVNNTGITNPTGSPKSLGAADNLNWPERYSFRSRHPGGLTAREHQVESAPLRSATTFGSPVHCYKVCVLFAEPALIRVAIFSHPCATKPTDEELRKALSLPATSATEGEQTSHYLFGNTHHFSYRIPRTDLEQLGVQLPQLKSDRKHGTYFVSPLDTGLVLSSLASAC
jgi:hypothetical protein